MLVNLTDVLTSEGKKNTLSVSLEADCFKNRMGTFSILEKPPITLEAVNFGNGKAKITADVKVIIAMNCDRCLKEIKVPLEVHIERDVVSPEMLTEELEDDDYNIMEGYQLDVEKLLCNEILMNWPMKVLCQPNCKGICKQCGKDLNEGECGCDTFVPDPRMAAIKDIFNANKEV